MILLWSSFLLILPAVFGGVIHLYVVKKNWFSFLKIPIHLWAFGSNKTIRGFVVMPLATLFGSYVTILLEQQLEVKNQIGLNNHWIIFGLGLGFFYTLFELPNSFIKRRLNIPPGKTADKKKWTFLALDYSDSTIGMAIFYGIFVGTNFRVLIMGMFLSIFIHLFVNITLFKLGIRKERL
jgi:CDP-diacylglycerol--serine O-phosphatidyltransferase